MKRLTINKKVLLPALAIAGALGLYLAFAVFGLHTLFIDDKVDEAVPAGFAVTTGSTPATFTSGAHTTTGTALFLTSANKDSVLRLENFKTDNGPDLKVYLRKEGDSSVLNLGSLKGNIGSQNYVLPANVKLTDYTSVDIWCERFSTSFGSAKLAPPTSETPSNNGTPPSTDTSETEIEASGIGKALGEKGGDRFPDVIAVKVSSQSERVFSVEATISSVYDTPSRYADAFRVVTPEGQVLGVRELTHDHENEQPFTRSLDGVSIPAGINVAVVEGRDQANGWGGQRWEIQLPE
jgi:Electron transfer DM13